MKSGVIGVAVVSAAACLPKVSCFSLSTRGCSIFASGSRQARLSLIEVARCRVSASNHRSSLRTNLEMGAKRRRRGLRTGTERARCTSTVQAARATGSGGADSQPIIYAQEALDRAWRFKRRANGNRGNLRQRLLTAFGGGRPTMFVDSREFMESTLDNVVRIYCTHNLPSWTMPWQRLKQEHSTSTGFIIEGRRIITNAHSVEYSTMVQVRRRGSDRKYQAVRLAVGEECDLAILTVEDEEFWEGTTPLSFGDLPELTDDVSVVGYPVGGECISITAGVVSRVEMTTYAQAGRDLLSIQIDAAINPGNSGGPVVNDNGEVVGVAFQSLDGDDVENIGYVVPVNVLEHFLEDVSRHNGKYRGFPRMGVSYQHLESPALRESLRMSPKQTGVMVTAVEPTSPSMGTLRKGDVLMKVDGIKVANDGSIPFRAGERVALRYYFSQLFPGDNAVVDVLRDDKEIKVTVPLYVAECLCPAHFAGRPPSYGVLGGLVFTVMSEPYLDSEMEDRVRGLAYLLSVAQHGRRAAEDEEVVILTQVLAHEANVGYENMSNLRLLKFNGQNVSSMAHLLQMADDNTEAFLRFDFYPNKVVVLDAHEVAEATRQICKDNSIPAPRSANFMPKERAEDTPATTIVEDEVAAAFAALQPADDELQGGWLPAPVAAAADKAVALVKGASGRVGWDKAARLKRGKAEENGPQRGPLRQSWVPKLGRRGLGRLELGRWRGRGGSECTEKYGGNVVDLGVEGTRRVRQTHVRTWGLGEERA